MDSQAANFNPFATRPTGDCIAKRLGCMARSASNYDRLATHHALANATTSERPRLLKVPTANQCVGRSWNCQ